MRLPSFGLERPYLLPLLLAALLPILLEILDRRRASVVDWAPMRLLLPKSPSRLRRRRALEALLVLLRSLALLLVALSLLGPFSMVTEVVATARPRALGIVLDNSPSMALERGDGRTSLDEARAAALDLLGAVPSDGWALVLPTADDAVVGRTLPTPGSDAPHEPLADARAALEAARPVGPPFRLLDGLERLAEAAMALERPLDAIHVFTDLRAGALPESPDGRLALLRRRLEERGPRPPIWIHEVGPARAENCQVTGLLQGPLAVGVGEEASLVASVGCSVTGGGANGADGARGGDGVGPFDDAGGGEGRPPVLVRLLVDGLEVASSTALAPLTGSAAVPFTARLGLPGLHRFEVALPDDALPLDNRAVRLVEVFDRIDVLLLGRSREPGAAGTTSFLATALQPRAAGGDAPLSLFRARDAEDPGALLDSTAAAPRVIVIAGLDRLDASQVLALESHVRSGGGLLVFAGSGTSLAALEGLFRRGHGVLPARLGPAIEPGGAPLAPRSVESVSPNHPVFSPFARKGEGDFTRVTARSASRVLELATGAVVLARLAGGEPWMIELRAGAGATLLVTTSAAADDSDFPLTPLFLPFVHTAVRRLAAVRLATPVVLVGERLEVGLDGTERVEDVRFIGSDGIERKAAPLDEGGERKAVGPRAEEPGLVEARIASSAGGSARQVRLAVDVPAEEGRLDPLSTRLRAALEVGVGARMTRGEEAQPAVAPTRQVPRSRAPWLAGLAALLLLAELGVARLLARRCSVSSSSGASVSAGDA